MLRRTGRSGSEASGWKKVLARQRFAPAALMQAALPFGAALACRHGQQRIGPQLVVIVQILISQRQPIDPLGHRFFDPVLDQFRFAPVLEAGGKLPHDARPLFDLAQEQTARIAGDVAAVEPGRHVTVPKGS